jgi:hypothetical protein
MRVSCEFPHKFPGPTKSFLFSMWKLSTVKIGNFSRNSLKTQSAQSFLQVETFPKSFLPGNSEFPQKFPEGRGELC